MLDRCACKAEGGVTPTPHLVLAIAWACQRIGPSTLRRFAGSVSGSASACGVGVGCLGLGACSLFVEAVALVFGDGEVSKRGIVLVFGVQVAIGCAWLCVLVLHAHAARSDVLRCGWRAHT